jgi:fatty acid desaturase
MESIAENIGGGERRQRFVMGMTALIAGAALAFALVVWGAPRWWRAAIFLPIWIAALGFFQAREKT